MPVCLQVRYLVINVNIAQISPCYIKIVSMELKLNVFTIGLREKNKPKSTLNWDALDAYLEGKNASERFTDLFVKYIEHFGDKFIVFKNWNKGINLSKGNVTYASVNRYIYGIIEGGYTDFPSTIKSKNNAREQGIPVTRDHVTSMPFYFIFWLPENMNRGLLVTQGISDRTIHDPLKLDFKQFIESFQSNIHVDWREHTTKDAIDKMKKGSIKKLTLRKSGLSSDKADRVFNKKYKIYDKINIEINITGFGTQLGEKIKEFITGQTPDLLEYENISNIGLEDGFEVLAKFAHGTKTATAKYNKELKLSPVYYIDPKDVPLDDQNRPQDEKMREYLVSFLEGMKKEIGL